MTSLGSAPEPLGASPRADICKPGDTVGDGRRDHDPLHQPELPTEERTGTDLSTPLKDKAG